MATVPLSGTTVRLLSGIPFNSDYKNTRWFANKTAQTSYFNGKNRVYTMDQRNFQRIEGKHFIAVERGIDDLWGTNYVMFQNAQYNNKWFYGFVTNLEQKTKGNTHVYFEIDVLQTWMFDMDFKPSFVAREHAKLWNADGTPVINTIDEGLDYGTDYDTVMSHHFIPHDGYKWMVFISKTDLSEGEINPSIVGTPQPLYYYAVPFKDDETVGGVVITGADTSRKMSKPTDILKVLAEASNIVNNIVSIYVTDWIGVKCSYSSNVFTFPDKKAVGFTDIYAKDGGNVSLIRFINVDKFEDLTMGLFPNKYTSFTDVKESKLLMHPYTTLLMDDFKGNRTEYKLEYVENKGVTIRYKGSLGTSNFTSVSIDDYNHSQDDKNSKYTTNETALINSNPSDVPVMNDMLAAFLQGNRNSLENQRGSVAWNGTMGAIGNLMGGVGSAVGRNPAGVGQSATRVVQGMGNMAIDLQAIQAKKADIDNQPPQISKMGSNTAYNYGNGYNGVFVIKKEIKPEYRRKLTDFFNMFGYKMNEVKIPNFRTRKYWNYVETKNCNILGNFNNEDLIELKACFDNGITLWHTDDVGNYALDNEVR